MAVHDQVIHESIFDQASSALAIRGHWALGSPPALGTGQSTGTWALSSPLGPEIGEHRQEFGRVLFSSPGCKHGFEQGISSHGHRFGHASPPSSARDIFHL